MKLAQKIIYKGELRKMFGVVLQYWELIYIFLNGYLEEKISFVI